MKFALESKQVTLPSEPEVTPTVESISEVYEGMLASYMELSDAQKGIDEVHQVMENINLSMKMIQKGGIEAVKLLNIDKSVESLVGVAEEKLTVEASKEGFGDAANAAWEKLKEWVKKFVEAIKKFLNYLGEKMRVLFDKLNAYKKGYQKGVAEGKAEYSKEFINFVLPEGTYVLLQGIVEARLEHGISKLVADLAKFADIVYSKKNLDDPELDAIGEKLSNSSVFDLMENEGVALACDGKADTLAKAGYSSVDQVFDEMERLGKFITESSKTIKAAMDKLAVIYTMSKSENPDSDMTKNLHYVGNCCSQTLTFIKRLAVVHGTTTDALGKVIEELEKKFNIEDNDSGN